MTLACDVVLLPSATQAALAIQCSELLTAQGSLFTLDNQSSFAHASLYMFQMEADNQGECIAALQGMAARSNVQVLQQTGYYYQDTGYGKGYVDIAYARTTDADRLQQLVLSTFNPLRAGMRESDKAKLADATGAKLHNLQQYGYPAIGELFRPHITLTKFPQEIEPDLSLLPSSEIFTGVFTKIGLFEMGENGTCIKQLASFDLQSDA